MNEHKDVVVTLSPEEVKEARTVTEYGRINSLCPRCSSDLIEDTYGYEKVVSCTNCEYSVSKTIEHI